MKKLLFLTLIVTCFASFTYAQDALPEIELANIDGEKVSMESFAENGKISVFTFWATWCAPCKKELSNIDEIYEDWQEDYNTEVIAVSIDNQRSVPKVKSYVNGQAWDYEVLLDTNQDLMRGLNFQNVPFTVVVDQKGNISYRHSGYVDGDEFELEEHLEELIEEAEAEEKEMKKDSESEEE